MDNGNHERRVGRLEQPIGQKPRDITVEVVYVDTIVSPDGARREVAMPMPDDEYETGKWRELPNGERIRVRIPREWCQR